MKKIISIVLIIVTLLAFTSCSSSSTSRQFIRSSDYNKAIIKLPDESTIEVEIEYWMPNTHNDGLVIKSKDGIQYRVNSVNCILIEE